MSAVGSILTNSGALTALNAIAQTSQTTDTLQNELASGLSISSPSDNPAGYITAQGFTSQINGLTQATSNANQGVSLLQTAQSAIGQQIGVVQQLNSIAVQAANGTQTASESQSLQTLVGQLTGQVSTIANQTQFNNINLLDGSFSGVQFQVGANEGQTMSLTIGSTTANSIGMNTSTSLTAMYNGTSSGTSIGSGSGTVAAGSTTNTSNPSTLSTVTTAASQFASGNTLTLATGTSLTYNGSGMAAFAKTINGDTATTGVSASVDNSGDLVLKGATAAVTGVSAAKGTGQAAPTLGTPAKVSTYGAFTAGSVGITGYNGGTATVNVTASESAASIATDVNKNSATTGVEAQATTSLTMAVGNGSNSAFSFTLQAASGSGTGTKSGSAIGAAVNVSATSVAQAVSQINATSSTTGIVASEDKNGNLVVQQNAGQNIAVNVSSGTLTPSGGAAESNKGFLIQGQVQLQSAGGFSVSNGADIGVSNASTLQSLASINVSNTQGANKAINVVKFALQGLNNQDGQLGAVQQRMTATINNLTTTSTNASTALGVVQDANIPAVANQLTQAQIQAQSGVAALKSSTQLAQTYLSLLP